MNLSYDPAKNNRNVLQRKLSFELAAKLEWPSALIVEDQRKSYPERRFQVLGMIEGHLHMLVFTPVPGAIHVISLRRASRRERARYDAAQTSPRSA